MRLFSALALSVLLASTASAQTGSPQQPSSGWEAVDAALGRTGKMQPGDVYKFGLPRSDMHVTVDGLAIKAPLALGSWVAFKKMGNETMVMGDLVLGEDEVEPVMLKLQQGGIEQTALHNHVLHETPRVLYMHIAGRGDAVKLAKALHDGLALTGTPKASSAPAATELGIDAEAVGKALGAKGAVNGGVLQFSVPRAEKVTEEGMEIPPAMGTATAINFQPTGGGKAAITGDFVLIGAEVNPVLRKLREGGVQVTAIHSHMLTEQPRLFFMHFWANDDAVRLAGVLRSALNLTSSTKP